MAKLVSEELESKNTALFRKLSENADVSGVLAALLGRIIIECQRRGAPITSVVMGEVMPYGDGEFRSRITFKQSALWTPVTLGHKNDFMDYLAAKGIALAKVLGSNASVAALFQGLAERLESWAAFRGIPFKELRVHEDGAFISNDNELVIRVERGQRRYKLLEDGLGYGVAQGIEKLQRRNGKA